jgi:quinol-cytochrome oxidoreductase complex cytochrome b subunit
MVSPIDEHPYPHHEFAAQIQLPQHCDHPHTQAPPHTPPNTFLPYYPFLRHSSPNNSSSTLLCTVHEPVYMLILHPLVDGNSKLRPKSTEILNYDPRVTRVVSIESLYLAKPSLLESMAMLN